MKVKEELLCGGSWCTKFFSLFQSPILLAIRIIWGVLFLQAGMDKWGDMGGMIEKFTSWDIPYPMISAYLVATAEVLGGICVIFGFLTRYAALVLMIILITAISTVHVEAAKTFLETPDKLFAELPFTFLYSMVILFAFGPGIFSVDAMLVKKGEAPKSEK